MKQTKEIRRKSPGFARRLRTMLCVDLRRMLTSSLFYSMLGIALVMPILVLTMTTGFGGESGLLFASTWQIIATESGAGMAGMDATAMMNINLMYFMAGVFVCLFVAQDFASGYAKNLFTIRARKGDYIVSKTLTGCLAGASFLLAFFVGAVCGGIFAGLPFTLGAAGVAGLVMCMLAKLFLMAVFVAIFLLMSVMGRQRAWLSICLSLFAGMLLFMMIPMMTPLNSEVGNVGMCLAGGIIFAGAIGAVSRVVLSKADLV